MRKKALVGLLQNYIDMRFEQICSGDNLAFLITLLAHNSFAQKPSRLRFLEGETDYLNQSPVFHRSNQNF